MPYSPNCSRPNSLAVITDAARFAPCAIPAPMRDQTAPLANRPRSESAAHMALIALVAPFHDLISVGIKSNLLASEFLLEQGLPHESWRIQPSRLRVRPQSFRWPCHLHTDYAGEPSVGRRAGHPVSAPPLRRSGVRKCRRAGLFRLRRPRGARFCRAAPARACPERVLPLESLPNRSAGDTPGASGRQTGRSP